MITTIKVNNNNTNKYNNNNNNNNVSKVEYNEIHHVESGVRVEALHMPYSHTLEYTRQRRENNVDLFRTKIRARLLGTAHVCVASVPSHDYLCH